MLSYLRGALHILSPASLVVECGGVGYEVHISLTTYNALSSAEQGLVYVRQIIRDDAHLLYGFSSEQERDLFDLLISVSGVGPNTARIILSSYTPAELSGIIATEQLAPLKAVKGIGLKTAQRILVDLRGKVVPIDGESTVTMAVPTSVSESMSPMGEEAVMALRMLGYPEAAASKVVRELLSSNSELSVSNLIKQALKML